MDGLHIENDPTSAPARMLETEDALNLVTAAVSTIVGIAYFAGLLDALTLAGTAIGSIAAVAVYRLLGAIAEVAPAHGAFTLVPKVADGDHGG